jgi:hypothetical protein
MSEWYSKKSLVEKLGIKDSFRILILNPPQNYNEKLGELSENIVIMTELTGPGELRLCRGPFSNLI